MLEYDENSVYAKTISGSEIHISEAASGRKGYYCLGCDREMQAVKAHIQNGPSYFRHDAKAVKGQPKCNYSDETHRHKLAKVLLAKIRSVKVPPLYKYPPALTNGLASLIEDSKIISASNVGVEKIFYEDQDGVIHCGNNKDVEEKHLIIKPDVTFFNDAGLPILLIELVATHKATLEKKVKLKRLGIDTIQIRIPKDSPIEIERCFSTTENTKWIYNNVEERTEYVPVSEGDSKGISLLDEDQRKLFEETFNCRRAQINNLIRSIERCLESKRYRDVVQSIGRELSRIETNTAEHRERRDNIRRETQERVDQQFEIERRSIEEEERRFKDEESSLEGNYQDLERRYRSKRGELENHRKLLITVGPGEIDEFERVKRNINEGRERNRVAQERIRRSISEALAGAGSIREKLGAISDRFERSRISIDKRIDDIKRREIAAIEGIKGEETARRRTLEENEIGLKSEFERSRELLDQDFATRNGTGNSELSRRIKGFIETRKILSDYTQAQIDCRRAWKAWECFKSGAYENWS
jgi:hypothetical protein